MTGNSHRGKCGDVVRSWLFGCPLAGTGRMAVGR